MHECKLLNKFTEGSQSQVIINSTTHPTRISGWYGNTEVFSVHIVMGKWSTATSTCLPSDIELAKKYVDIMNQVLLKLQEIN